MKKISRKHKRTIVAIIAAIIFSLSLIVYIAGTFNNMTEDEKIEYRSEHTKYYTAYDIKQDKNNPFCYSFVYLNEDVEEVAQPCFDVSKDENNLKVCKNNTYIEIENYDGSKEYWLYISEENFENLQGVDK